MALFNFFKKKENNSSSLETTNNELFLSISKYNEYIARFIGMQQQGNYAPISAFENNMGEIIGFLYVQSDNSYSISAGEVVLRMENKYEHEIASNVIKSYVILYHSQFDNDNNHNVATNDDELKAITIAYNFKNGRKGKIGLPYYFEKDEITYKGFKDFSQDENNRVFVTQLKEGYDYFQEREEIKAPVSENGIGLRIKKSNNLDLNNIWCGIFGFESFRKGNRSQILNEYFAQALGSGYRENENVRVAEMEFDSVLFRSVLLNNKPISILPVIKTDYVVDVVNKEINEWENVDNLEAIITGRGRDTFGISYFASDYAENREIYQTKKELKIKLSGIAFVLDISNIDKASGEIKYREEFTMYMPNNDLPNYACFDFVGQIEDLREIYLLNDHSLKSYIMKVRLITNPDIKDFFTIDIYVTPENMRISELSKGMKITGMFQMQGQIVK
jgi:hypothetical protein